MPAPLFVIVSSADHKVVNRLLLHLRDWEYGEDPTWDNFHLITTAIIPETVATSGTNPPITENDLSDNIWASQSISDVESFMLNAQSEEPVLNKNTFIILDEQGMKDGTVVLLDLPYSEDDATIAKRFNKVRVPWEKAYIMWCNLDIANMNFEDFVDDEDEDEVEWWTYADDKTDVPEDVKEKKNSAIADLEEKGLA